MEMEKKLELLNTPIELRVLLNELRIMLNCFRDSEYQMALDDEPDLDADGLAFKESWKRNIRKSDEELDSIIDETTGA